MPEHQSNTTPDSGSATAEDTSLRASDAPLAGISVSEPEDARPRVNLEDLPEDMRAACLRAGWQGLMPVQSLALPYLLPEIARQLSHFLATAAPWSTLSLIWTVVAWAFLPAGLFMRGMAILRAARQIERSCRETSEQDGVPA